MKNLFLAMIPLTSIAYGQTPTDAVKKCVVSIDFFDTTSLVKESTKLSEVHYYNQSGRLLEEKDIAGSCGLFSGIKYHYSDSFCIQKEYLGNSRIDRNEFFFYKNNKLVTIIRIENGPLKVITDYAYDERGLESAISVREYHNGILTSENITRNRYDSQGRNIESVDLHNADTAAIMITHYDSTVTGPAPREVKERKYNVNEVFAHFDSAHNKEHKWSYFNGGSPLEEERIFNNHRQLLSMKSISQGEVGEEELFTYDALGRVTRHEVIEPDRKMVYRFEENMPIAVETWFNGKLYSIINYSYSAVPKKRK